MGTGGSFLRGNDEDDILGVEYDGEHGVVKRIPIEVKPRGRLGVRSVRSLGKSKGGSSLKSALSLDLENPEVERIRKEFEMYRLNTENELTNAQKKVQKLESECKRLRVELQMLQKTCRKLREERDGAIDAEHQALVRAAAFESDRDKIQRQFKIFRETKESELQNLLKRCREFESKLTKIGGHSILDDTESSSRLEPSIGGHPGDWWTTLESEPSLGSTTQLHTPAYRGPEFGQTMLEMEGPYLNVNKEDWNTAAASLAQVFPTIPESLQPNTLRIYVCGSPDTLPELNLLTQTYDSQLRKLCASEGRFCTMVVMPGDDNEELTGQEKLIQARCRQIDQASIFLAFVGTELGRFTEVDCNLGHLNNPGARPAVFCCRRLPQDSQSEEVCELKQRMRDSGSVKLIEDYEDAATGVEMAFIELETIIKQELGLDQRKENAEDSLYDLDGPSLLCGGSLWDINHDFEQMEALNFAARSSCELGFEKHYEQLNMHISAPGPLPPLLVSGSAGSGKSLLLAKWIELQQHKLSSNSLVLHHFVGSTTSCSADATIMIRRLNQQLLQQVASPPTLTCDPVRLIEDFPKWLEKVSSKLAGGVILVLDSLDKIQNGEVDLTWLLDPLPVDSRVIVSVQEDTCPLAWRSWPTLHMEELSNKRVKELLRAELASLGKSITAQQESRVLTHCRSPATCSPLYVVLLASDISRCNCDMAVDQRLDSFLATGDTLQLYKALLDALKTEYETGDTRGMLRKVCRLIYASRNGLTESELFDLLPGLTWNYWAPLCDALTDRHILTFRSGLLIFAHQQAQEGVEHKFLSDTDGKVLRSTRQALVEYHSKNMVPGEMSYRVADELPWLNRQLGEKESLHRSVLDLCVFVKQYGRGRCAELISYWQYIGLDKATMAKAYFDATKQLEEMVGQFNGLVTLPRIADMYDALGRFLRDLGLLSEALQPLQRALEIRETALDPDHPSVAQSLHQVAGLHAQQGKFQTAEALYKQSMEIYEGAFSRDHFTVARELDALAMLYQKQGKHELAEPLHKRAMSIRRRSRAPRVNSGHIRGVDHLRRRVLQLEELAMGPDTADLARTLNEIGVLYYLQNNIDTAETFFKRSLEIRETVLGADHSDAAQSLNNLAALYNDRKQYENAEPLYTRALAIRRKVYSDDHPSVLSVVKHLGMLYKKMGKLDKAEPLYKLLVGQREQCFGLHHPAVATALVNLAVVHSQMSDHSLALPLYERALKIYEDSFGPSHPRVAETLRNLALLKYEQGEYETAAKLYKRATEIRENEANTYTSKIQSRRSSSGDTLSTLRNTPGIQV